MGWLTVIAFCLLKNKTTFSFYGSLIHYMQVVLVGGQLRGTVSWEYDSKRGEFVRDDNDFIPVDTSFQ
jgi:hypothetical protein